MNGVEALLKNKMENKNFQEAVSDDFGFVDSLIDQQDLEKLNNDKENEEGNENA